MNDIILEKYGKIECIEEYYINKNNSDISYFYYFSNNKNTKVSEGKIEIECSLLDSKYETNIKHNKKDSDKIINCNFNTLSLFSLDKYIDYIELMLNNTNSLSAIFHNYDNSNIKTENGYEVELDINNLSISIGPFDKDISTIVDGRCVKIYENNKIVGMYILSDNGYRFIELDDKNQIISMQNIVFTGNNDYKDIELSNILYNDSYLHNVPNLSILPTHIKIDDINFDIFYDKLGLPKYTNESENNILYEEVKDSNNELLYISSLHPMYFDKFDTLLSYSDKLYCLDIIIFDYDDENIKYTRTVYKIDDDKFDKFTNTIKNKVLEG